MKTIQLLEKIQFIVDAQGKPSAVLISLEDWEKLLTIIEDLEGIKDIHQSCKASYSEPRKPGYWKDRVKIASDFDSLPDEIIHRFLGE